MPNKVSFYGCPVYDGLFEEICEWILTGLISCLRCSGTFAPTLQALFAHHHPKELHYQRRI